MFSISALDLAIGLKELLLNNGYTLDALLKTTPAELALILGIDMYVARIIYTAARRHVSVSQETEDSKDRNETLQNY